MSLTIYRMLSFYIQKIRVYKDDEQSKLIAFLFVTANSG